MGDIMAEFDWPDGPLIQLVRSRAGGADGRFPAGTDLVHFVAVDVDSPDLALTIGEAGRLVVACRQLIDHFGNVSSDGQLSTVVGDLQLVVRTGDDDDAPHGAEKYATARRYVWLDICHQYGGTPVTWAQLGAHDAGRFADTVERFYA